MPLIDSITAYLPYISDGGRVKGLRINIGGLQGLTIIVGRNASGKTSLLEALGYTIAVAGNPRLAAQALAVTRTMRPRATIPLLVIGTISQRNSRSVTSLLVDITDPFSLDKVFNTLREHYIGGIPNKHVYMRVLHDATKVSRIFESYEGGSIESSYPSRARRPRSLELNRLNNFLKDFLGRNYEFSSFSIYGHKKGIGISILHLVKRIYLAYIVSRNKLLPRSIVFDSNSRLIAVARRDSAPIPGSILVFHPGFVYRQSMFESLYYESVKQHALPGEQKAIRLLRSFMPWFNGFELIGRELHLRSKYGERISVYELSDGQRAAAFLGLLYAISPRGSLVLIDTPEAFVHPDGLSVMANLIARIVYSGNQVIMATQSMEMIRLLLKKAKENNIIAHTLVKHVQLFRGQVLDKGSWRGEDALNMIEEIDIDLRKA